MTGTDSSATKAKGRGSKPKAPTLAERAVEELKKARDGQTEPLTMSELAARLNMPAEELLAPKTLKGVLVTQKAPDAPVMLPDDAQTFANSDRLLRFAVSQIGTQPPWDLKKFLTAVKLHKDIKPKFQAALETRLADQKLPADFQNNFLRKVSLTDIASNLINTLKSRSSLGPAEYPVLEANLLDECTLPIPSAEKKKGLKDSTFTREALKVTVARKTYYLLSRDASCDGLEGALRSAEAKSGGKSNGFEVEELVASVAAKDTPRFAMFKTAISNAIASNALPQGIGSLRVKGKAILFRTSLFADSATSTPHTAVSQPAPSATPDFARAFEAAFERLLAKADGRNFIKVFDLRRELPQFSREAFDAGLRKLRETDKFTMESYEGNNRRYPEEEIQAGIREGGSILIHVSRKGG